MSDIAFKGKLVHTSGNIFQTGSQISDFILLSQDLSEKTLADYAGKRKVLNIFPSLDTPVCATSVRKFNEAAVGLPNTVVLNVSQDLPFAQSRFCVAEGIKNAETLSAFRSTFAKDYGVEIIDSPLKGLCARAVIITDKNNTVLYSELVREIAQEPDYQKALSIL